MIDKLSLPVWMFNHATQCVRNVYTTRCVHCDRCAISRTTAIQTLFRSSWCLQVVSFLCLFCFQSQIDQLPELIALRLNALSSSIPVIS